MRTPRAACGLGWSTAAAATVVAVFTLSNAPTPMYVRWQAEWGFSSGTLTVVFAAYIAGLISALLVTGRIADRRGCRFVLIPGMVLVVVSSLLFLLAQDVVWLLVARLLAGIAVGAGVTAGMAAVVDLAPPARRRTGSLLASTAMVTGAGLGPLLTGLVIQATSSPQTWVFGLMTLLMIAGLILACLLPLSRPTEKPIPSKWRLPSPPREQRRELIWGAATFAPGITATSFVLSLGPSVLAQTLGVSNALLAGATACAMFLTATGIQFALSRLSTRTHLLLSSMASLAAMMLLAVAVSPAGSTAMFVTVALLAGAAQGMGQLAGLTLIATRIPLQRRAESNATLNIAGYVPAALLPVTTGYLVDAAGLPNAVTGFAAALIAAALIALVAVRVSTGRHLVESSNHTN